MAPKSIWRQPGAQHFQLVHRSQRDPLIHDPEASAHVLKGFERENLVRKGKTRADLEQTLPYAKSERANIGEAAEYGVYFDDTNYDYMQHLRPVGMTEDSVLLEAPNKEKGKGKNKEIITLPGESLPSQQELSLAAARNAMQSIPSELAGFNPDLDQHLRQTLEALDDDAFVGKNLKDVHTLLNIPGVPPIKGSDMPTRVLDRNDEVYDAFISFSKQLSHSSGIIINTFEALENRAIKAITEELCFRNIYPIGPLIVKTRTGDNKNVDSCLNWLDSQPEQSVVFLCFGSLGLFSQEQLKDIAIGLERSEQRFLWVVRNPPELQNQTEPDLEAILPDGFLNRTGNRGMVVKSWAPQVPVLNHKAIGGFVTHCGWNSILEAVCVGVPMVAWPLYAEQRFNRAVIVEEIKIAISMNKTETGFVSFMEVEKRVREVVEEGPVRERTKAMKNAAESALVETGSSRHALTALLESWSPKQT